jgi:hypothetical protein
MGSSCVKNNKKLAIKNVDHDLKKLKYLNEDNLRIIKSLEEGSFFCDNQFLADNTSILYNGSAIAVNDIKWKRAKVGNILSTV